MPACSPQRKRKRRRSRHCFLLHVRSRIRHQGKRICQHGSHGGYGVPFPYRYFSKQRISQICRFGHFILDCDYDVPDRASLFVTSLLKLPETMTTLYFVGMTALSLIFYVPINKLAAHIGKKKLMLFAFAVFSAAYFYTGFLGIIAVIPSTVQGAVLTVTAALPMAIFGILPQAVVADIAQSDAKLSGSNREGILFAFYKERQINEMIREDRRDENYERRSTV